MYFTLVVTGPLWNVADGTWALETGRPEFSVASTSVLLYPHYNIGK